MSRSNRRALPKAYVVQLARRGLSPQEIAKELGVVDGVPFHAASVSALLKRLRKTDPSIPANAPGAKPSCPAKKPNPEPNASGASGCASAGRSSTR